VSRALLTGVGLLLATGCLVQRDEARAQGDRTCTRCHGDATREGSPLLRSAPPSAVSGDARLETPGVGAHLLHLRGTENSRAVECGECHRVPRTTGDEGHNDGVTQLVFGAIATRDGGLAPTWNLSTRQCTTSGCHGPASGQWTSPRSSADACGSCHGVPPALPHPQAGDCAVCHEAVMASTGIRAKELHVDGVTQWNEAACSACHGDDETGAPPRALDGGTAVTHPGVGAHAAHLSGGRHFKPVACATCHEVPARAATPTHPNGGRAEVKAGVGYSATTGTCATACHGGTSPAWTTEDANLGCTGCHGAPPALPHPQVQNCALCHDNSRGGSGRDFVDRTLHVNGAVEAAQPAACTACHGDANPAPPKDTWGNTATTIRGVGAHQAHVVGRGMARVVACNECHVVPATVVAPGHLDGVTQVRFSGVAFANGASPSYVNGTCAGSACHDVSNYTGAPGGGQATTPSWTVVDGSQRACTSCHGFPPPLPHPADTACGSCHQNATSSGGFVDPSLHINGRVDFARP
jgi:hypothetical protein